MKLRRYAHYKDILRSNCRSGRYYVRNFTLLVIALSAVNCSYFNSPFRNTKLERTKSPETGSTLRAKHVQPYVYPYLQGGLGNQLFVMSAAVVVALNTNRTIVVNAEQTAVASFGVAQPVFWQTVFFSDFFHKDEQYDEVNAIKLSEEDLFEAQHRSWEYWCNHTHAVRVVGSFLSFELFTEYRHILLALYKPTSEIQRWVNDAAIRMQLVPPSSTSSVSASYTDDKYRSTPLSRVAADVRNTSKRIKSSLDHESTKCSNSPIACTRELSPLPCLHINCANNVAIQLRLQDRSTDGDYLDYNTLSLLRCFTVNSLVSGKRVVVFSNDPARAAILLNLARTPGSLDRNISYSTELNVVDFFLMSQYFNIHVLTGSSFQLWAIFFSYFLPTVKLYYLSSADDFGFKSFLKSAGMHRVLYESLDQCTRH